jgi:sirohydrochlorin ferrochelatase
MRTLLLIAHGSRRPEANADLEHVATQMRRRGGFDYVQCSFLELTHPDIHTAGVFCVQEGATEVVMLPYFLSPGVHVRDDLTEAREKLQQQYPKIKFLLAEPLGRHPALIDIVAERAAECLGEHLSP